jgi:hypothetical protein
MLLTRPNVRTFYQSTDLQPRFQQLRHLAVVFGLNIDAELGAKPSPVLHNALAEWL